jgi:parallel beta-helix repeat protein
MDARTLPLALVIMLSACNAKVGSRTCAVVLAPGDDDAAALQEAIESVPAGQRLCLSGRFVLDAPIEVSGATDITIAGETLESEDGEEVEGTVLDFAGLAAADGALVFSAASGLVIEDVTVESPPRAGIIIASSEDVTLRRVVVVQAEGPGERGEDGIRVTDSSRVRVDSAQLLGGRGAGVSFTRSEECVVESSAALEHLAGVLIADSERCEVRESELEVNGIGVLVADLPSDAAAAREITVRNNLVIDSGFIEQAAPIGSPWPYLPHGVGVLVLAADDVELAGNAIEGNRAAGVLVLSWGTLDELAGAPPGPAGYDGDPSLIHAHDDTFLENGFDPSDEALVPLLTRTMLEELGDVVWDGAAEPTALCARPSPDAASTFLDLDARDGFATVSTDPAAHDCMHPGHALILP